jgi:hypothetical protein
LALLPSRTLLFILFQVIIAAVLWSAGTQEAWQTSAYFWPFLAIFANLVSIGLLVALMRREDSSLGELYRLDRSRILADLAITIALMIVMGPLVMLPNLWLAERLFGSSQGGYDLMFRPLPLWAAYFSLLFPATIGFAELPTYFGYIKPRLAEALNSSWLALGLGIAFLSLQHAALPLIFDSRFILWRALMFLPFALAIGLALNWRPRLMPYMMAGHALIDLSTVIILISLSG